MAEANKIYRAGDVEIKDVTLITSIGFAQTITPQVVGIEIYEDLFAPFITGKIFVLDSQELTNLLPLVGEESLRLSFKTPSLPDDQAYTGEFFIVKMEDRLKVQERQLMYVLHFISKEAINDMNTKISRGFSGLISDIAKKLIEEPYALSSGKTHFVETTRNETKYVSNFWSPVKNLQYLTETAVNQSGSPSYLFFETKYGLNFTSLDKLYSDTPLMQRFVWDNYSAEISPTGTSRRDINKDFQRILDFQTPTSYNYIDRLKSGMYGSEIIYYDILTKQYVHKGFVPQFTETKHLNNFPLYSTKVPFRTKGLMMVDHKYYNNFDGYDDVTNIKTIQLRKHLLAQAEAYKVIITVFGRTDYSVGQRVFLDVPKVSQISVRDKDVQDKIMSGAYLIAAVSHLITRENHECTMELIKDSYMVNLNEPK